MKKVLGTLFIVLVISINASAQNFKTVKVGNIVWMAENLDRMVVGSWSYNDSKELGQIYGRLYTWEAAKRACPAGWKLPTEKDWQSLIDLSGGEDVAAKNLKTGGKTGFNALLGGMSDIGNFRLLNSYGTYWTASEYDKEHAWYIYITANASTVTKTYFKKAYAFSVRCVKDK
jgi:uncharacterized protein (TIGR02145 family)